MDDNRLVCWPCFQCQRSFFCNFTLFLSLSTMFWPSWSLSRLCWYSCSCSASSCRLLSSSSSCHPQSLSRCPSWSFLAFCSRCRWSHSRSHRCCSCWNCCLSLCMLASSTLCFSKFRYFSCSRRRFSRELWPRQAFSFSCRSNLWSSLWLSWIANAA